jgi:hypothetical protein
LVPPTTFASRKETEIPSLQNHCFSTACTARNAYLRRFALKALHALHGLHFHLEEMESDRLSKEMLSNLWETNYLALSLDLQSFLCRATSKIKEDIDRLIVSRLRETSSKIG